jgi:hypothetical protein
MEARRALTLLSFPFLAVASVGHTLWPRRMAREYAWVSSPWYQRQLASFEVPHLYAMLLMLRGRGLINDAVYLRMQGLTGVLLGVGHFAAIAKGDRAGAANWLSGSSAMLLGVAGLVTARAEARRMGSSARPGAARASA